MTPSWERIARQKLLFARLLLAQSARARPLETALIQGALHHLHAAYCAHLHAIATAYQIPCEPLTAGVGCASAVARDCGAAELVELRDLESDAGSWLSQLLHAHARLPATDATAATAGDLDTPPLIASDHHGGAPATRGQLSRWLHELDALLQRQCALLHEC